MTVVVVMGVSGCGKSTIARMLADETGQPMLEGDSLHPAANIEKMHAGTPLTDEDRWPWLRAIAAWTAAGQSAVVTCSSLKRAYRDLLRESGPVGFAHLDGPREVFAERLAERQGHFMPASLLGSQFAALEPLGDDEPGVVVDVRLPPRQQVDEILAWLAAEPLATRAAAPRRPR